VAADPLPPDGYCAIAPGHEWHGPYHDSEYGFPVSDDRVLFERLVLEINQAGLSWLLMLKRREGFRAAFLDYDIDRIAVFGPEDEARLREDARIIRNRLKIAAVVHNAGVVRDLAREHGSFAAWLDRQHPLDLASWTKLMRKTFKFMGPEVVNEFLMSTGYLPGAHHRACPVHAEIAALSPPWMRAKR
jgi:DNA-3-methyladenine glycosylase I